LVSSWSRDGLAIRRARGDARERVLGDAELRAARAQLVAQIRHLGDREAGRVGDDHLAHAAELGGQRTDDLFLALLEHVLTSSCARLGPTGRTADGDERRMLRNVALHLGRSSAHEGCRRSTASG